MLETIVIIVGLIFGTALLKTPQKQSDIKSESVELMKQCSIACGENRMEAFTITYGKCECIKTK